MTSISNGESGSSVRSKLNTILGGVFDALTVSGNIELTSGYLQVSSAGSLVTPSFQMYTDGRGFWAANGGVVFKGSGGNFWGNDGSSGFGVWSSMPDFVHVGFGTSSTLDVFLSRAAAATLQLGNNDAAAPVAQTTQVQSVIAGTSNTAGADWTIAGSKGTGTGIGGAIIFKTAPAGGSGSSQNALTAGFTINPQLPSVSGSVSIGSGPASTIFEQSNNLYIGSDSNVNNARFGFDLASSSSAWGTVVVAANGGYGFSDTANRVNATQDTIITRGGAATVQLGQANAAAPVAQTLQVQSVVAGTTDTAGTDWTRTGSKGTGTGAGGNIVEKTGFSAKSTGSTQHTTVDRDIIVAKGKVLTSAAAFSMFDVALPTLSMCGGVIEATIVCTDGTDMQSFTQTITYSAVNKGGVYTTSITPSTGDKSVSSGTLTTAWSIVSGSNKVTIKVTPTTSLTPSANSFLLYYRVKNNSEQATTIL